MKTKIFVSATIIVLCAICATNLASPYTKQIKRIVKSHIINRAIHHKNIPQVTTTPTCGIDISHHQGHINWNEVSKDDRIQYVYIKATEGSSYVDNMYRTNAQGAKRNNILVGAYHFYSEKSSPKTQFENFKKTCPKDNCDLIPMIDVEPIGKLPSARINKIQQDIKELALLMERYYGKKPLIYCSTLVYDICIFPSLGKDYLVCIGHPYTTPPKLRGNKSYDIWQYTYSGKVNGIKGSCDMHKLNAGISIENLLI